MAFYAKVRKTDNHVRGLATLDLSQAGNWPVGDPLSLIEITEGQYNTAQGTGVFHDGSNHSRYLWSDPNFDLIADPRPVVTFTPDTIDTTVSAVVTVDISHSGGLDGVQKLFLAGVPVQLTFVAGLADDVPIDTDLAGQFVIGPQQAFAVAAPLTVTIYATELSRKR